jgi:transposase
LKYQLNHLVVVADAGMLSEQNINFLEKLKFSYIVGARLKGMSKKFKAQIFRHDFDKKPVYEISVAHNIVNSKETAVNHTPTLITKRLIIDYSEKRAKKDKLNREKLVKAGRINAKNLSSKRNILVKDMIKSSGIDQTKVDLDQDMMV